MAARKEYAISNNPVGQQQRFGACWLVTSLIVSFACLSGLANRSLYGQDLKQEIEEEPIELTDDRPVPRTEYKGRTIAQTMHFSGAEWLIRNEREREERCSLLLTNLGLKPGQVVCDMGCGNGFYALQIAQMIGDRGRVIGVDVQPEMLNLLRKRMEDRSVNNLTPVLGSYHDPRLPHESCDLILLVDVYHEFSFPELMLSAMRTALKPGGRIALVEYRMEDPDVPIKLLHKMSKKQILKEFLPNGFRLAEEFDELPWQHVMFFEKDDSQDDAD